VKAFMSVMLAGVLLGGAGFVETVEAGDHGRRGWKDRRAHDRYDDTYDRGDRYDRHGRHDRYFYDRDVVIIREYYRPHYRPLPPGLAKKYYRSGWLPPGWARRVRLIPRYIERDLVVLPRGYRRGIIDGHAVVFDSRGFIIDVAVLF